MNYAFYLIVFPGFLFSLSVGILTSWVVRKVSALVQWRVGPPVLQPFYDLVKLTRKETLIPKKAPRYLFLFIPLLGFSAIILSSVILFRTNLTATSFLGDIIVVYYLLLLPSLTLFLGGLASGNSLSILGASREIKLILAYELPFIMVLVAAILKAGGSFQLLNFIHTSVVGSISGSLGFIVSLICVQAKLGFVPFDIPEAETEIMGGPLLEYSGLPLAVFYMTQAMTLFVLPVFLITVFLSGFGAGLGLLWGTLKYIGVVVLIVLIQNTNPRLRIDQALKSMWAPVSLMGFVALLLAIAGSYWNIGWL